MATQDTPRKRATDPARTASETADAPARYDTDLYSWTVQQADLLRAGRLTEIDAPNIAEELDDVGNEQYDKLESALTILLMHLLKWDHQPRKRSRSWENTIREQRPPRRASAQEKPRLETAAGRSRQRGLLGRAGQGVDRDQYGGGSIPRGLSVRLG